MERAYKFMFDKETMKPGCVLLQAIYGGDRGVCHFFNEWELAPSKSMVGVTASAKEVKMLAEICNRKHGKAKP